MENRAILREWFDRVDAHKSGNITAPQLKSAFAVGNLHFTVSVVQQMIRMYDLDRNGTMSFEEFVELNKFLLKVQQAFSGLERGRGFLVPDEAHEALVKVGFSLDSPAFYTVCESFDQSRSGKLKLDDFISLCIFVQSARNMFTSFDTSKQGRVTLDFNQFIYCSDAIIGFKNIFYFVIPLWKLMLPTAEYDGMNLSSRSFIRSCWQMLLNHVVLIFFFILFLYF